MDVLCKEDPLTRSDQPSDMSVARHFAGWDLLNRAVYGVEEGFCFVGSCHCELIVWSCYVPTCRCACLKGSSRGADWRDEVRNAISADTVELGDPLGEAGVLSCL